MGYLTIFAAHFDHYLINWVLSNIQFGTIYLQNLKKKSRIIILEMARYSKKVKEIHDEIEYQNNIVKANELLGELLNPLDIAIGKLFTVYHYLLFEEQTKLLELLSEIEDDNTKLKDQFIQFMVNIRYCTYYSGFNNPVVSAGQAKSYLDKFEQSFQKLDPTDEWEKFYCEAWYYHTKAYYEYKVLDDLSAAIKFQEKAIKAIIKIPGEREEYYAKCYNNLGVYYRDNGNFEEAEKSFYEILETDDVNEILINQRNLWPLENLTNLNFIRGNLGKAEEFNSYIIQIAKQFNNIWAICNSLSTTGFLSYQEADYDKAIKAHYDSLEFRKQLGDPLPIFWGHFTIFYFYYSRFKMTKIDKWLEQAKQIFADLQGLSKSNPEDVTILHHTNYANSLILRHGNIRKKGKAIDLLEELVDLYPNNIGMSLNLLDLLFEDVLQSEDHDTIAQIDELMEGMSRIPMRNNPQSIYDYISKQVILAKYKYYIKSDPNSALEILNDAISIAIKSKLDNVINELQAEIQVFENELTKWEKVDRSYKDRVKASEFNKYIDEALIIADQSIEQ
jgi:hypothetical protein